MPAPVFLGDKIDQCLPIGTLYNSMTVELGFLDIFTFSHVGADGGGEAFGMKGSGPLPSSPAFRSDGMRWGIGVSPQSGPSPAPLKWPTVGYLPEGLYCMR